MRQFNATYRVTVFSSKETTIVEYPITCKFTVTRNTFSDSNRATIQLYNLAPATRNRIFQDQYYDYFDKSKHKYIHIEAGYDENGMSLIFKGRILQAYSFKSGGQTEVITEIQAVALDIFDCQSSQTLAAGTSFKDGLQSLAADMPNVVLGNTGSLEGTFKTPTTFCGNTHEQINKITGGHSFVDNGVLNTLMDNEVIDVPVPVISNNTNLLETPMRRDANLEIKTRFYPDLVIGQLVEIDSSISPNFNGQFKLVGLTHDCLISKSVAGNRTTQMTLWIGPMLPNANIALTGQNQTQQFSKVNGEKIQPVQSNQPSAVQDVYRYIQQNNGKIPNTKITANISWKEMLGNNNTDAERKQECSLSVLTNVYNTAATLQKVLNQYFPGKSIKINSGWRSVRNNRSCNGKPTSKHLSGLAIDFNIQGVKSHALGQFLNTVWVGWVGVYADFVHVQINPSRGRANDR